MSKQIVVVERAGHTSIKRHSLYVEPDKPADSPLHFPLRTLQCLVLETGHNAITMAVLQQLSDAGIPILICGTNHLPSIGVFPFNLYAQRAGRIQQQIHLPSRTKARLWRKIVQAKIINQSRNLPRPLQGSFAAYAKLVEEGDPKNVEAVAAGEYFRLLIGTNFSRRSTASVNSFFNYGYAIVRSVITQTLMAHGLEPSIGIWHAGQRDPLNLTYDLIEPFRAFVDHIVLGMSEEWELSQANRIRLLSVLQAPCVVQGTTMSLQAAISTTVTSFVRAVEQNSVPELVLPEWGE